MKERKKENKCWQDKEKPPLVYTVKGAAAVANGQHLLSKSHRKLPSTARYIPQKSGGQVFTQKAIHKRSRAALLTTVRSWKQPKCP